MGSYIGILVPVVAIVAVFTFVTVATWAENRRKEREAFYRQETYRRILERGDDSSDRILHLMRQEEAARSRRRIERQRLGGLITAAVGLGILIFLYVLVDEEPVYLAGLIPLLIGLVLAFYGFVMAPLAYERERAEWEQRK